MEKGVCADVYGLGSVVGLPCDADPGCLVLALWPAGGRCGNIGALADTQFSGTIEYTCRLQRCQQLLTHGIM